MSGKCTHSIDVINLDNNEIVNHSILLIKGHVRQPCFNEKHIKLYTLQSESEHNFETLLSCRGDFKFILNLQHYEETNEGVNPLIELKFVYCDVELMLNIVYAANTNNYRLQPLLIVCSEEIEIENNWQTAAQDIIALNLRLVQCIYADKLRAAGFGRCTFALNPNCQLFRTQLPRAKVWECDEQTLWQQFADEILNSSSGHDDHLKFVAFIACTKYDGHDVTSTGDYSYNNIRKHLRGHAALGGGGLALFGTAYFYAWPRRFADILDCFRNDAKIDLNTLPDDSNYRRTYGGVYATTLGAICHELGHIFDLGHTIDGVMGSGFDYVNRIFTIDNATENLPARIVERNRCEPPQVNALHVPRFTRVKKLENTFLDKYREQKANDSFYFTRNCGVILALHKWLRIWHNAGDHTPTVTETVIIEYDYETHTISLRAAELATEHQLRIVEIRSNLDSLVTAFYEFPQNDKVKHFQLPERDWMQREETHYVFAMTETGHCQSMSLSKPTTTNTP